MSRDETGTNDPGPRGLSAVWCSNWPGKPSLARSSRLIDEGR
jgi:hypothetical protein